MKNSDIHYHLNGDILIFAKDTCFCVHKIILEMASPALLDKLEEGYDLPTINLPDENSSTIDIALSIIYPRHFIMPIWSNVEALLHFADKYTICKVYVAGIAFLDQNFKQKPEYALYLANKYQLSFLFTETSKLILDQFPTYEYAPALKRLPREVYSMLETRYLKYMHDFARLSIHFFLSTYKHRCGKVALHNKELTQEIEKRILIIVEKPIKPPSTVWDIMHEHINVADNIECHKGFMKHLDERFKSIFGKFEPLNSVEGGRYISISRRWK
ncbi:18738_t:CDS:1 [Funneliformis geosporum]|uniref:5586_t:CDS:1 n=1 Tax=Funneliformis geosporum TaxID=1117311 RepID=A0A9W4WLY8_9GLOM|nr:18738_t:CDS:1 [Funneliformis geosporum]CAI2171908.1 5586_t:CDS:1 [Funneliformis geosporum]